MKSDIKFRHTMAVIAIFLSIIAQAFVGFFLLANKKFNRHPYIMIALALLL